MKHIVIRGARGIGKTTLIRRLIAEMGLSAGGFSTVKEKPDAQGISRICIYPASLPQAQRCGSETNCVGMCRNGRFLGRNTEVFDTLGVAYLHDMSGKQVILMDELGFMESEAEHFQEAVLRALDGTVPVIAAVKDKDIPFLERVCGHPNARLWQITRENRQQLFDEILPLLSQLKQTE